MKKNNLLTILLITTLINIFYIPAYSDLVLKDLSVEEQLKFFITLKKYDINFMKKGNKKFSVGLITGKTEKSIQYREEFQEIFDKKYLNKTFFGIPIELAIILEVKDLINSDIDILIIGPDTKEKLKEIITITQEKGITSFTGIAEYLNSGISVIVASDNGRPLIAVNLENSEKENSEFSARMLQMAKIIKNK